MIKLDMLMIFTIKPFSTKENNCKKDSQPIHIDGIN